MSEETTPVATETPAAVPAPVTVATETVAPVTVAAETGTSESAAAETPAAAPADGPLPAAPDELTMLNALKQVVDPELFVNIVDLGLVYGIQEDDHKVLVDMTLTSPACPAGPQIISQAKSALEAIPGVKEATIKLVMSPPWTPDRMTDEARDQLGIF